MRKGQFERLFYNRQASTAMSAQEPRAVMDKSVGSVEGYNGMVAAASRSHRSVVTSNPQVWKVEAGDVVRHKKFGEGKVVRINRNEKYIFVRFALGGEKKFIFPDAFSAGFLELPVMK